MYQWSCSILYIFVYILLCNKKKVPYQLQTMHRNCYTEMIEKQGTKTIHLMKVCQSVKWHFTVMLVKGISFYDIQSAF